LLSQGIKCARMKSWCLEMIKEYLCISSMRLGVPFYSPKAARSRWRHFRKAILAFCRVAHRTVWCTTGHSLFSVRCRSPSKIGAADRCRLGAVGALDTVQCPHQTVGSATRHARIARPTVGSPDSPVHHRTVR
jgi:hypothetical protein